MKSLIFAFTVVAGAAYLFRAQTDHQWLGKSAQVKMEEVWQLISSSSSPASWFSSFELLGLFLESMQPSFDHQSDWIPEGRKKLIHSQGMIVKAKWAPVDGHNYTGLFASGSSYGLVRFSLAKQPPGSVKPGEIAMAPGVSVKFFRDGRPSGNFMAMYSLDGQNSWNFFENQLSNHVDDPKDTLLKLLAIKFRTASKPETKLGLSDFARYDASGQQNSQPKFPYRLFLKPSSALKSDAEKLVKDLPISGTNWLEQLQVCKPGVLLYSVFAQPEPFSKEGELILIGNIYQEGEIRASEVADRHLFFQHVRFAEDAALRPDWRL